MSYKKPISGGQISASATNALAVGVGALFSPFAVGPGLALLTLSANRIETPPGTFVWVQITGPQNADKSYPYMQVVEDTNTPLQWDPVGGGDDDAGMLLYPTTISASVANGSIVQSWPSEDGSHLLFNAAGIAALAPGVGYTGVQTIVTAASCDGAGNLSVTTAQFTFANGILTGVA